MRQICEIVHSRSDGDRQSGAARAGEGEVKVVDFVRERLICLKEYFDPAAFMKASRSWGASWAPSRAKAASAMWVQHVEAVKSGAKKLSHQEFCEIRYEDLWNSPCDTLKGVAEFLGISWSENAINLAIDRNKPEVMETGGTPIPVYGDVRARTGQVAKLPRGFIGKARPDAWRSDLSMYEKYEIWRNTRKIMGL